MNKQTIKNKQAHKQTNKQTKLTNNTPILSSLETSLSYF
jgi:hypothetical protein